MNLELNNPSAFHALRVSAQTRARNVVDKAGPAAAAPKRYTREELVAIGSEIVMVMSRGTAIVNGAPQSVTRDVPGANGIQILRMASGRPKARPAT